MNPQVESVFVDHSVGCGASLHNLKLGQYLWIILWDMALAYTSSNRVSMCGSSCGMLRWPTHSQIESVFVDHPAGCGAGLHILKSSQYLWIFLWDVALVYTP